MQGYDASTYGEAFADVYDDWYDHVLPTDDAVVALVALAAGGSVLELGVGTGRLAIPLAARGLDVTGLDASDAMLARLRAKPGGAAVRAVRGDMAGDLPGSGHALVFVAYNTLFNLPSADVQRAVFARVEAVLRPGGCFVVEGFVPAAEAASAAAVELRHLAADRVVLSAHRTDAATQRVEGSYIELSPSGGVRLRPWSIRYSTPDELDEMARTAGFTCEARHATWSGAPFTSASDHHVSIYRRRP